MGIETFSMRWQVAHSKVRCSKPGLATEIPANPILCLQVRQDGRSAIEDAVRITLPQGRRHQLRAPIDQKKHDQHHYNGECKPPNGEPITPTARRPIAPATWRNVTGGITKTKQDLVADSAYTVVSPPANGICREREFGNTPACSGRGAMPGTPNTTLISLIEIKADSELQKAGHLLTPLCQRLSFDLDKVVPLRQDRRCCDDTYFYFHFLASTLLEDEAGQPFPDADAALQHAKTLAAQFSNGGHLTGTILVAKDTMPKNPPPPTCSKCSRPMHFMPVKTGGRKFRCINCDVADPLKLPEGRRVEADQIKVAMSATEPT
jgi:hypothetical protein